MDNKVNCICGILEEISEFFSLAEFERFQEFLGNIVNDGELFEIPVQQQYAGFLEQWYKCKSCSQVWRLVYPDYPFKGLWKIVQY